LEHHKTKKKNNLEDQIIAYEAYVQTIDRLQHFNRMQTTYRTFASTWLLGTFFAIGYSLSSRENLPFSPLIVVALLCLASSAGIVLIWYMDLMMCERMIATALFEGLEYEKKYSWIPKIHQSSHVFHSLWGYVHLKSLFYIGYFAIVFETMGVALAFHFKNTGIWFLPPTIALIIISLFAYFSYIAIKNNDPYLRLGRMRKK
jgi:hypothetical protein